MTYSPVVALTMQLVHLIIMIGVLLFMVDVLGKMAFGHSPQLLNKFRLWLGKSFENGIVFLIRLPFLLIRWLFRAVFRRRRQRRRRRQP